MYFFSKSPNSASAANHPYMDKELIELHENHRQNHNLMEYQSDAYMEAENDNQSETSEVDGSDIKVPTA